jgi:hypothetical protein
VAQSTPLHPPLTPPCSYGEKLLSLDDGSGRCSEFYGATSDLVASLAALVKTVRFMQHSLLFGSQSRCPQNHSHGLVWNPRGEDFFVEASSAAAEEDGEVGL